MAAFLPAKSILDPVTANLIPRSFSIARTSLHVSLRSSSVDIALTSFAGAASVTLDSFPPV